MQEDEGERGDSPEGLDVIPRPSRAGLLVAAGRVEADLAKEDEDLLALLDRLTIDRRVVDGWQEDDVESAGSGGHDESVR